MSNNETEESAIRLEAIYNKIEEEASEAALMWPWGYSQRDYEDGKPRPAMEVNAMRKEYYKKGATPYAEKWHEAEELLDKMAKALKKTKAYTIDRDTLHTYDIFYKDDLEKALTDYQTYKQRKDGTE